MIISLNEKITIPGEHGEAPIITKNGNPCSLDDPVETWGSYLVVIKGEDGREPSVTLNDLLDGFPQKAVIINSDLIPFKHVSHAMDLPATPKQIIQIVIKIECILPETIEEMYSPI